MEKWIGPIVVGVFVVGALYLVTRSPSAQSALGMEAEPVDNTARDWALAIGAGSSIVNAFGGLLGNTLGGAMSGGSKGGSAGGSK